MYNIRLSLRKAALHRTNVRTAQASAFTIWHLITAGIGLDLVLLILLIIRILETRG